MNDNEYKAIFAAEESGTGAAQTLSCDFVQREKQKTVFTGTEKKLALIIAGLGFLFVHLVLWHTTGFLTTLFYILLITGTVIFLDRSGHKFTFGHACWTGVLYTFAAVFSITANSMIKLLDVVFLGAGIAYLVYCVTTDKKMFGRFMPFEMHTCMTRNPMSNIGKEYSALGASVKGTHFGKNLGAVICGGLIAVPLTLIVGSLLISADKGMADMVDSLMDFMHIENLYTLLWELAVSVPVSGYLFGLIYSHTHKEISKQVNDSDCEALCKKARTISNTVAYTAVTPICVLYVMFFISQANYFLSAFYGRLPEGYSFAEYARKGFFELFAIELINAGVIFFINFFSKKCGEEKTGVLRFYTVMISVFTLLITATAISKMVMYIDNFGLTQLRVYTTWFMVLTAFIFVYVIIKQFKRDLCFMKCSAVTFVIMFAVLCFSRVDSLIVRVNLEYYSDRLGTCDVIQMSDISGDAAEVLTSPEYRSAILRIMEHSGGDYDLNALYERIGSQYNAGFYDKLNLSSLLIDSRLKGR